MQTTDHDRSILEIKTLGCFSVSVDGVDLARSSARCAQVWKLFKYIVTNRATPIPTEKIIDVLWPEGDCDNPLRALYNLVYRLRNELNNAFSEKVDFFTFQHNCYVWNAAAPYALDTQNFEALLNQADSAEKGNDTKTKIDLYQRAFDLYHGDYLAESASESWVLPIANYYKRLYTALVEKLCGLYKSVSDYQSIVTVCQRAIELDPFEERHHANLIEALIRRGQLAQAQAHYDYITVVLDKELGVRPSESLLDLYRQIHQSSEDVQSDITAIAASLAESNDLFTGAYYCDLEFFRKIYQIECRALERSGQSVYLVSLTITTPQKATPSAAILSKALSELKRATMSNLRRGDVVTQYSKSQILLLLASANYENCEKVIGRLRSKFFASYRGEPLTLLSALMPIQPASASK